MVNNDKFSGLELITNFDNNFPIYRVGKDEQPRIHRFFDTSPISPSGKYIALTEFATETKNVEIGDAAKVVVFDLKTGELVYSEKTFAWDSQLGCHLQWGLDDNALFFNKMEVGTWVPYAVKINIFSNKEEQYKQTVYMVSFSGKQFISACLKKIRFVMPGYGVLVPDEYNPIPPTHSNSEGVWLTDVETKETRLLISLSDIYNKFQHYFDVLDEGYMLGFHVKWSADDKLIMFVVRWNYKNKPGGESCLFTMDNEGNNLEMAVDPVEWRGGHHPNWSTSDNSIIMNLKNKKRSIGKFDVYLEKILRKIPIFKILGIKYIGVNNRLYFKVFDKSGKNKVIVSKRHLGSGHPILIHNNSYVISDAYLSEHVCNNSNKSPLRLINWKEDTVTVLANVPTKPLFNGVRSSWRIDPHPVTSKCSNYLIFNGLYKSSRQVFVMDISTLNKV